MNTGWRWKLLVALFFCWWVFACVTNEIVQGWITRQPQKAWPPRWKDLF